jgi:branched-subunit amino acid aminotransferase/4-amino-4-deoxychorismate lyase
LAEPLAHMEYLWRSGEQVRWDEAQVHITKIGWPALTAAFEGTRAYRSQDGHTTHVFRLDAHLAR